MIAFSAFQTADMKTDGKRRIDFFLSKISKRCFSRHAHTLVEVLISEGKIPQGGKQHLRFYSFAFLLTTKMFKVFFSPKKRLKDERSFLLNAFGGNNLKVGMYIKVRKCWREKWI